TRSMLAQAACVGNGFDLETLAELAGEPPRETLDSLWQGIEKDLVRPLDERYLRLLTPECEPGTAAGSRFEFANAQARKAAYALLSRRSRSELRLRIGRLLLRKTPQAGFEDRLFEIVDHLNEGFKQIEEPAERRRLVELNLTAGRKAKRAGAYGAAVRYLNMGIGLLPAAKWKRPAALTRALYLEAVETEYLDANFDRAEMLAREVLERSPDLRTRIRLDELRVLFYTASNRPDAAIEAGREALELLGVFLPEVPAGRETRAEELEKVLAGIGEPIEALAGLPHLRDERAMTAMRLLADLAAPAHERRRALLPSLIARMVAISAEHGNSPMAALAYGWYGALLCGKPGDIARGRRFGLLSLEVVGTYAAPEAEAKVGFLFNTFVRPWVEHARESIRPLMASYQAGLQTGELQ
ncbi:MAG: hypothetical protein Q8M76_03970, partial [Spirochaetaceae bacterium]|nr:hypothetical protein [Spirochaetaceae bacterium]